MARLIGLLFFACAALSSAASEPFDDGALRRSILAVYPDQTRAVAHPPFNRPTDAKIELGRMLFFDPHLSRCGTVSCASCHLNELGWASSDAIALGCNGRTGRRRPPSIEGVAHQSHFFWDGRVQSLEQQALVPITAPTEMDNSWDTVLTYLASGRHAPTKTDHPRRRTDYARLFAAAFQGEISPVSVTRAIAAFERSIADAGDTPIDRWLGGDDAALDTLEKQGLELFFGRANCAVCHPPPHYTDGEFHNIGVPAAGFETPALFPLNRTIRTAAAARGWVVPDGVDLGRQEAEALRTSSNALGAFKTPSLRNVARRARFMHNGAFGSLDEVLRHYEATASGDREPLVGELAFYVRYRKAHFGALGGGSARDIEAMRALMEAFSSDRVED